MRRRLRHGSASPATLWRVDRSTGSISAGVNYDVLVPLLKARRALGMSVEAASPFFPPTPEATRALDTDTRGS